MTRTTVRLPDDLLGEAKDLARRTGRTLTQLLEDAVRAELARIPTQSPPAQQVREQLRSQVADIQAFLRTLPDRDGRAPDEILGYDDHGLPS